METLKFTIIQSINQIITLMDFVAVGFNILGILLLLYTLLNIIKAFILTRKYTPVMLSAINEFKLYTNILFILGFGIIFHLYAILEFALYKGGEGDFPNDMDILFTISYIIPIILILKYIKDGIEKYRYKKYDDYDDILKKYNLKNKKK